MATDPRALVLSLAAQMVVVCGGCGTVAKPDKVLGIVVRPQWDGTSPFAIVAFRCESFDCGEAIPVEVDAPDLAAAAPTGGTPT